MVLINVKSQIAERDAEIESLRSRLAEVEAQAGGMRAALSECRDELTASYVWEGIPAAEIGDMSLMRLINAALSTTLGADVAAVIEAAREYRQAEQDGTPRMWRGKDLQDLASALDAALEKLGNEQPRKTGEYAAAAGDENDCGRG